MQEKGNSNYNIVTMAIYQSIIVVVVVVVVSRMKRIWLFNLVFIYRVQHIHSVPKHLQLKEESTFLDIGSGFGKCVFHTALTVKVVKSTGIEYVQSRHVKAVEVSNWIL